MNVERNMKEELDQRRRAAWVALVPLKEATDQLKDPRILAHLSNSTALATLVMLLRRGLILQLRQEYSALLTERFIDVFSHIIGTLNI